MSDETATPVVAEAAEAVKDTTTVVTPEGNAAPAEPVVTRKKGRAATAIANIAMEAAEGIEHLAEKAENALAPYVSERTRAEMELGRKSIGRK